MLLSLADIVMTALSVIGALVFIIIGLVFAGATIIASCFFYYRKSRPAGIVYIILLIISIGCFSMVLVIDNYMKTLSV